MNPSQLILWPLSSSCVPDPSSSSGPSSHSSTELLKCHLTVAVALCISSYQLLDEVSLISLMMIIVGSCPRTLCRHDKLEVKGLVVDLLL